MTIQTRAWNEGETAPASWDTLPVLECDPRFVTESYLSRTGIDGVKTAYSRRYLAVTLKFGADYLTDPRYQAILEELEASTYIGIGDPRHDLLPYGNTVTFVKTAAARARDGATLLSQVLTIELISHEVV